MRNQVLWTSPVEPQSCNTGVSKTTLYVRSYRTRIRYLCLIKRLPGSLKHLFAELIFVTSSQLRRSATGCHGYNVVTSATPSQPRYPHCAASNWWHYIGTVPLLACIMWRKLKPLYSHKLQRNRVTLSKKRYSGYLI